MQNTWFWFSFVPWFQCCISFAFFHCLKLKKNAFKKMPSTKSTFLSSLEITNKDVATALGMYILLLSLCFIYFMFLVSKITDIFVTFVYICIYDWKSAILKVEDCHIVDTLFYLTPQFLQSKYTLCFRKDETSEQTEDLALSATRKKRPIEDASGLQSEKTPQEQTPQDTGYVTYYL